MDFIFRWVLPIATIVSGAVSGIAHGVFGVSHPIFFDWLTGVLTTGVAAKASYAAHSPDATDQTNVGA